jgi:hypothetical protein
MLAAAEDAALARAKRKVIGSSKVEAPEVLILGPPPPPRLLAVAAAAAATTGSTLLEAAVLAEDAAKEAEMRLTGVGDEPGLPSMELLLLVLTSVSIFHWAMAVIAYLQPGFRSRVQGQG